MISEGPHFKAWMAAREWQCRPGQGRITLEIEREGRRRTITTHCLKNARVRRMAPVAAAAAAEPVDRRSHALSESGLYRTRRAKGAVEKPAAGTDGNRGYAQRYRISVSRPDRPALPRRPLVFPTGDFAGSLPHASRNSRAERHAAGHPPPEPNRKNIFLTGPSNLSHYESVLDFVRYAGLGYLVGTNTEAAPVP